MASPKRDNARAALDDDSHLRQQDHTKYPRSIRALKAMNRPHHVRGDVMVS